MTYRECSSCRTKVPYTEAIYRLEQWVGSEMKARTLCRSCLRQLVK